jgi:hypothetical protein
MDILSNITHSLDKKISDIKAEGKTPIIFLLIGSCPSFSYIQQTPPVILEHIKDPNISPIVFIIDKYYENKPDTLDFLDLNITNFNNFKPGHWYYPTFIPKLNDTYNGRVAYQFYPQYIKNEEIFAFMKLQYVVNTMTLIWSFTGLTITPPFSINNNKMLIPEGNCSADTKYDPNYFPQIINIDNEYFLIDMDNNYEYFGYIVNQIHLYFHNTKTIELNQVNKFNTFVYYSLKRIIENLSNSRSWEIQLRVKDQKSIVFNKKSTQQDWDYFKERTHPYFNMHSLYIQFMKSNYDTLTDFINNTIYDVGNLLIKLNIIETKYTNNGNGNGNGDDKTENNESIQLEYFIKNYFDIVSNNIRGLPNIFKQTLEKYESKCGSIRDFNN